MRLYRVACFCLVMCSAALLAESKNPNDYPFRVHIFPLSETNFYRNGMMGQSKGEGRANLFSDGDVRGINFSFECSQKLKPSFGFETYPAKWKKPNQELVVLLPVFGKAGSYFTCNLKTEVKDYVYFGHNGRLDSESPDEFKTWMVKHNYDPEHGKNMPTRTEPQPAASVKPMTSPQ